MCKISRKKNFGYNIFFTDVIASSKYMRVLAKIVSCYKVNNTRHSSSSSSSSSSSIGYLSKLMKLYFLLAFSILIFGTCSIFL
jgi:hypothetical protein